MDSVSISVSETVESIVVSVTQPASSLISITENAQPASVTSNELSNLISGLGAGSVTSDDLSVTNNAVSVVDSRATSLADAISVISNALSSLSSSYQSLVDRVSTNSAAVGGGSVTSAEYQSLVDRVSTNSAVGGGGSVTSNELSAVEVRVNNLSDAVSNETSNRISVSAVLDAKISSLSAIVISGIASVDGRATSLETKISTLSAILVSGIVSVDSRVNAVSNNLSNEISNRTSADGVLANTISVLSTTLSPYYAFPTGISVTAGTLISGGFSGLSAFNGEAVLLSEVISTVPFAMTLQLSTVSQIPNRLLIRAWYEGNAAHSVGVDIFNHVTSAWDNYGEIPSDTALRYYEFNVFTGANLVSVNNARVRIVHNSGGTNTHSFQLDYLALAKLIEGAGITNHNALQGLADDDHLQYALADGSRGFTVISDAVSAIDVRVSSLSDSISNEISNRVSISAVLDAKISTLSALVISGIASVDGRATSLEARISTVSGLLGGGASITSAEYQSLVDRVSTNSAVGGGGSVTSNELSALNDIISNEISNRVSVSAVLDAKISNLSAIFVTGIASVEAHASAASAAAVLVDGRATSLETRISTISSLIVTGLASAEALRSTLSAVVVSGIGSVDARITSVAGLIPVVSATSNEVSVQAASIASAKDVSLSATLAADASAKDVSLSATLRADYMSAINVLSDLASGWASAVRNASTGASIAALSLLSDTKSAVANVSAVSGAGSATGLQNVVQCLSARITSVAGLGGASATSDEISILVQAASAAATSVGNLLSAHNIQLAFNADTQSIAQAALVTVSGLSVSLAISGLYTMDACLIYTTSAAAPIRAGLVFPACHRAGGRVEVPIAYTVGGTQSTVNEVVGWWNESASTSIILSAPGIATAAPMLFRGNFLVSNASGKLKLMAAGSASSTNAIHILKGSYLRVYRIQ